MTSIWTFSVLCSLLGEVSGVVSESIPDQDDASDADDDGGRLAKKLFGRFFSPFLLPLLLQLLLLLSDERVYSVPFPCFHCHCDSDGHRGWAETEAEASDFTARKREVGERELTCRT